MISFNLKGWFGRLLIVVVLGGLLRSYGITQPWAQKDHYNFGGPWFSRFIFCMDNSDWTKTRGRIFFGCAAENDPKRSPIVNLLDKDSKEKLNAINVPIASELPDSQHTYYLNHPPLYPWLLYGFYKVFGEFEWVFKSVTLIFSTLNILLVGLLAKLIFESEALALAAALLQACFLGTIYFGTHVDYPSEINATFFLLSIFAAIKNRWTLAVILGLVGGAFDWVGFFILPGLWILSIFKKQGLKSTTAGILIAPIMTLGIAAFLKGPKELIQFFVDRLTNSIHHDLIARENKQTFLIPIKYVTGTISSYTRLLGPIFLAAGLFAMARIFNMLKNTHPQERIKDFKNNTQLQVIFLLMVPTILIATIGAPYLMIHSFWLIPTLPMWAFLVVGLFKENQTLFFPRSEKEKSRFRILIIFALVTYPYGILKTYFYFDLFASLLILTSAILVIYYLRQPSKKVFVMTMFVGCLGNFCEVVNYRFEPPLDREFCLDGLKKYLNDGEKIDLGPTPTKAKLYYCRGIPQVKK